MVKQPPKCPRCGSQMVLEYGTWHCLNDSEEITDRSARSQFLEDNKDDIIAIYKDRGMPGLKEAYGLSSSAWFSLRKRWGVELNTRPLKKGVPSINGSFPELPVFSNDWLPEVQLKWLEVWGARR